MRKGRSAAVSATIACLVSAPLAVAAVSAHADEISDLRANQQLLQQRLDQLAQARVPGNLFGVGGPPGPTSVQMMGGSFPRSFLIPGTDTSIRIGGEIREVVDYWLSGGNPNASPQNTTVGDNGQLPSAPLHVHTAAGNAARSRGTGIFMQSPRESKLSFETRTPTAWGEARTYMEFDWAGSTAFAPGGGNVTSVSDNLHPRLRFAYGTLGGVLAGQANSNFSDPDANAEVIDFGGNVGEPGVVRVPQVRYTVPLAGWGILGAASVSAETPETDAMIAGVTGVTGSDAGAVNGQAVATTTGLPATETPVLSAPITNPTKAFAPDLTLAWYIPQSWGHTDFSAVVRPALQLKNGAFIDRSYVGWGIHWGGDVKPHWFGLPPKDDIIWHFTYGDGIGRYLNSSTNFSLVSNYPAATPGLAGSNNVLARTTVEWGGEVGYQHWWAANLRSNISMGINHHDIPNTYRTITATGATTGVAAICSAAGALTGAGNCSANKELISAHINLLWNPVPFVDVGIEYMYGHRLVLSNLKGDENVLISKFGVKF